MVGVSGVAGGVAPASASKDLTLKVWDPSGDKDDFVLERKFDIFVALYLAPDGKRLVVRRHQPGPGQVDAGSFDLEVWDLVRRKALFTIPSGDTSLKSWIRDGRRLAYVTTGPASRTGVWDVDAGRELIVLPLRDVSCLALSPDGRRLVTKASDVNAVMKLWDLETRAEIPLPGPPWHGNHAAWSPDGRWLACAEVEPFGVIRLLDTQNGREALPLPGHPSTNRLEWSPNGKRLLSSGEDGGKVWDVEKREELFYLPKAFLGAWSPDGERFCSIQLSRPGEVVLWDALTFQEAGALVDGLGPPRSTSFPTWDPEGRRLVTANWVRRADGVHEVHVRFWDASAGYALAGQPLVQPVPADLLDRCQCLLKAGDILRDTGHAEEAERSYRQALAIAEQVCAAEPRRPDHRRTLVSVYRELATRLRELGRAEEAETAFRQARKLQETLKDQAR